jgi:hypothetical protein
LPDRTTVAPLRPIWINGGAVKKSEFGSEGWVEEVFAGKDARQVAGRSRPTQRFGIGIEGKPTYAEGGNESVARGLMLLGVKAGLIRRWKFQPFEMTKADHGVEAFPDLQFQLHDERVFIAEIRSARYQTPEKLAKAKQIQVGINASGRLKYLYWTDAWPLTPGTTALVRELRKCGTSDIPQSSIDALQKMLKAEGPKTFYELRSTGCFRDVVLAAVWQGKAHIDLLSTVTDSSIVTSDVYTRRFHELLNLGVEGQTWWSSLSKPQPPL